MRAREPLGVVFGRQATDWAAVAEDVLRTQRRVAVAEMDRCGLGDLVALLDHAALMMRVRWPCVRLRFSMPGERSESFEAWLGWSHDELAPRLSVYRAGTRELLCQSVPWALSIIDTSAVLLAEAQARQACELAATAARPRDGTTKTRAGR